MIIFCNQICHFLFTCEITRKNPLPLHIFKKKLLDLQGERQHHIYITYDVKFPQQPAHQIESSRNFVKTKKLDQIKENSQINMRNCPFKEILSLFHSHDR